MKTTHQALMDADLQRLTFKPLERFINFEEISNPQGETIYVYTERSFIYLATNDFRKFFPLRVKSILDLSKVAKGETPKTFSPVEFIWLFDSYGLEEALKSVILPIGVTKEDLLVTSTPVADKKIDVTTQAETFNNYLWEVRRRVHLDERGYLINSGQVARTSYVDQIQNLAEGGKLGDLTPETFSETLSSLDAAVSGSHIFTLTRESEAFIYVPEVKLRERGGEDSEYYLVKSEVLEFTPEYLSYFIGFLTLGSFDSVVKTFIEYKRIRHENRPYYKAFIISEIGGKEREIHAPDDELNKHLKGIAKILSAYYEKSIRRSPIRHHVMAFRPNRGILHNVVAHDGNRHVIKCDIKDFYKSVRWKFVRHYLEFIINPNKISDDQIKYNSPQ